MANTTVARQTIHQVFTRKHSLNLSSQSVDWLLELVNHFNIPDDEIADTMEHLATEVVAGEDVPAPVPLELLLATYEKLRLSNEGAAAEGSMNGDEDELDSIKVLKIVDSYKMPALRWSEENNTFELASKAPVLVPGPLAKSRYLRDRFNIIKQVILRNEHFSPPALATHASSDYMKLTSIKNMLGRQGNQFLIFGMLARMEDGALYLEDLDDRVQLDLSEATLETGLFTEGSFVLVDGEYTLESTLKVYEMGHPPSESRATSRSVFGHLDFLGVGASISVADEAALIESERKHATSFIVLSDLHLDSRKVMKNLEEVLSAYEGGEEADVPALWIMCGNFRSRPWLSDGEAAREYKDLFTKLANLIASFPTLCRLSHFLFVPGPTDPYTSLVLPQAGIPDVLTTGFKNKVPNVTFASNPCRIRWFSQEICIFREDMMSRLMRNSLKLSTSEGAEGEPERDLRKALVQTLLDQAHLSPLPLSVRPILWDFDHALRLYPMPTTLILADRFDSYKLVYEDCLVFNPGAASKGKKFAWATYYPNMPEPKDRMEESELLQ